ncbi:MAG: PTS sugar transporter subunit IIA [Planctomycetes bacterium]|nr:PTS sugar transporter subunit IIA [Planctomycetota bacterium]
MAVAFLPALFLPARFLFLVLTPVEAADTQLRILRDIACLMTSPRTREALTEAETAEEVLTIIRSALASQPSHQ